MDTMWNSEDIVGDFMTFFSVVAIILNATLLPVIAFRSGKEIGSYKVLLFFYTFIALIYTSISCLMVPVFAPSEKGWLFYATKQRIAREIGSNFIWAFSACYVKLLLILTYSFVYRFLVMCLPNYLYWFHKPSHISFLVIIYWAVFSITAGPVFYYMRLNEDIMESFENEREEQIHICLRNVSYIGAPIFKNGTVVKETAIILIIWTITMTASTSISIFCIAKIIFAFRDALQSDMMSQNCRRIQRKLFSLLILQTLIPLCFTFLPGLLSYVLAIRGTHAPIVSHVSSALLPLAQAIDPILTFTMIADYHQTLCSAFRAMKTLIGLILVVSCVHATAPADWLTCKVSASKISVLTVDEENMRWSEWPNCHVKIYQSPQSDTFYVYKGTNQFWWESYGSHQKITDGFYKWLPETQLEISVKGDQLTLKIGENAMEGAYGLCFHQFGSRDPPCVDAWGTGGPPP